MNDLSSGAAFGKWTVLDGPHRKGRHRYWLCQCECGNEKLVNIIHLKHGVSTQCRSCASKRPHSSGYRFGEFSHLPLKLVEKIRGAAWNAISRCTNTSNRKYSDYGGRGIEVRFIDATEFVKYLLTLPGHDVPGLVLDRIDNNSNYEKGNLRFTTYTESSQNSRPKRRKHA